MQANASEGKQNLFLRFPSRRSLLLRETLFIQVKPRPKFALFMRRTKLSGLGYSLREHPVFSAQVPSFTAVLASDWCQKTCVFLAPIRSQNGGDCLELVW